MKCLFECESMDSCCNAKGPKGFLCTRHEEHKGGHVACGVGDSMHEMEVWDNEEED